MMNNRLEAPLFRGATKTVMFFGIPINALLLVTAPSFLVLFMLYDVLGYFSILLIVPPLFGIPIMRQITKQDDQFLNMFILDLKERHIWSMKNQINGTIIIPPKSFKHHRFMED